MSDLAKLIAFLDLLEEKKIYYRLNKIRDSLMIEIAVPGQRWEVEFMVDGSVVVEKFLSSGQMFNEDELGVLLREYSD